MVDFFVRLKDPSRWVAFNEDGKMWGCVHEWFSRVSLFSKASDNFCTAVCEVGIVPVLGDIFATDQIYEAHVRNNVSLICSWPSQNPGSSTELNTSLVPENVIISASIFLLFKFLFNFILEAPRLLAIL